MVVSAESPSDGGETITDTTLLASALETEGQAITKKCDARAFRRTGRFPMADRQLALIGRKI